MLYYGCMNYRKNKDQFFSNIKFPFLIKKTENMEEISDIAKSVFHDNYKFNLENMRVSDIYPAHVLSNFYLLEASRNIIYKDEFFNKWDIKTFSTPNQNVLKVLKYHSMNVFTTPKTNITVVIKFIERYYLYPKTNIKVLPFLSSDKNIEINLYDIIHSSIKDILNVIIFPKNITMSEMLMIMKLSDGRDNFKFFIMDDSNQLYESIIDKDVIIYRKC